MGVSLFVAALPGAARAAARHAATRPNVVVLMTDDQTVENMKVMPHTRALVARQGTSFSSAFATYPLCSPSRTTFLTGQFAHNHHVYGNLAPRGGYGALTGKDDLLPVWMRRAGYDTIHVGKYPNGYGRDVPADVPLGWDEWYGSVDPSTYFMYGYTLNENGTMRTYGTRDVEDPAQYQTDVYRDLAVRAIDRRRASKRPFFLSVAFLAPHSEGLRESGETGDTVRPAPRDKGRFASLKVPRGPAYNEADVRDKPAFFDKAFPLMDDSWITYTGISYRSRAESLLAVDEAVRRVVAALKRSGKLDNTLLVFMSDNGFFTGEHRVPLGKYLAYEPAARIPVMMRGPAVRKDAVSDELVENVDVPATIVAAAGAKPGRTLDGRSLLPFAKDPKRRTRRTVLLETTGQNASGQLDGTVGVPQAGAPAVPPYMGVRTRRYVYLHHQTGETELYDLQRDPNEMNAVTDDPRYAATKAALARQLRALEACRGRACRVDEPPVPGPRS